MAKRVSEEGYEKEITDLYRSILNATENMENFPKSYDEAAEQVAKLQQLSKEIIQYGKGKPKEIQQLTTQLSETPLQLAKQISTVYGLGISGEIAVEKGTEMLKSKEEAVKKWPSLINSIRSNLAKKIKELQQEEPD
jgi:hypothetical protein